MGAGQSGPAGPPGPAGLKGEAGTPGTSAQTCDQSCRDDVFNTIKNDSAVFLQQSGSTLDRQYLPNEVVYSTADGICTGKSGSDQICFAEDESGNGQICFTKDGAKTCLTTANLHDFATDQSKYLKEGEDVGILFGNDQCRQLQASRKQNNFTVTGCHASEDGPPQLTARTECSNHQNDTGGEPENTYYYMNIYRKWSTAASGIQ